MVNTFLITQDYAKILKSLNISYERAFKKLNIPTEIDEKGYYISRNTYIDLVNYIFDNANIESLINFSDISKIKMFIPPIFAGLCAKDGIECFNRISKYKQLFGPFILKVTQKENNLSLEFKFDDEKLELPQFVQITEMLLMINLIRIATNLNINPSKVETTFELPKEVRSVMNIKENISNKSILYFSLSDAKEPFISVNNTMWEYLKPEFNNRLEELTNEKDFSSRVRSLLLDKIAGGLLGIENLSDDLGLSVRSIQRRLKEENTTFIKQLNIVRSILAKNYLVDENMSTKEVAFLVGYSDEYVFMRAFKQWTGLTVKQYLNKTISA